MLRAVRLWLTNCRNRRASLIKHAVLDPEELPTKGTLISIDAEFVALQQVCPVFPTRRQLTLFRKSSSSDRMVRKRSSDHPTCHWLACRS